VIAWAILSEELARVHGSLPWYFWHRCQNALFFSENFNDAQRERYAHLLNGTAHLSACVSESGAGSDPSGIQTTARRTADGYVINGRKIWTSGGGHADAVLVFARAIALDGSSDGFGLFLVERSQGFVSTEIPKMGLGGHSLCEMAFDDVKVEEIARVGGDNAQGTMYGGIGRGRIMTAVVAVGLAQAALDTVLPYVAMREQFGKKIGEFQLVQSMIAKMAMGVTASRLMVYNALSVLEDKGDRAARVEASMAKAFATETAVKVASLGIQILGGMGVTKEMPAERIFRDARMLTFPDGTTQIQELIIGRELTGLDALR
jgi:alkylation response protein AidB-like acyl-CoA dehydrogenase